MAGISVKLPLSVSAQDGAYTLNKDLLSVVKQNFKMLILTNPGEKIMDPEVGVGIQKFLKMGILGRQFLVSKLLIS